MNYRNTLYLLNKRPDGMPEDNCWAIDEEKITYLHNNEILIKADYLSIVKMN